MPSGHWLSTTIRNYGDVLWDLTLTRHASRADVSHFVGEVFQMDATRGVVIARRHPALLRPRSVRAAEARPRGRTGGCSPLCPCDRGSRPGRRTADGRRRPYD